MKNGFLISHSIVLAHLPFSTPTTLEDMRILIPNPDPIIPSFYPQPNTGPGFPLLNGLRLHHPHTPQP